jgi:hypothetical protein
MIDTRSSKILRAALFILVPTAYVSIRFWRSYEDYGPTGREGISAPCTVLMLAVFVVSLLSWNEYRVVASLGLIACFLYLAAVLLPVL